MRLQLTPLFLAIVFAHTTVAHAQTAAGSSQQAVAPDVQQQLERLEARVDRQQNEITTLRSQVEFLELGLRGRGLTEPGMALAQTAPQTTPAPVTGSQPQTPVPQIGQASQEDDAQRRQQEKALVVQEHAPLFERKFTFETGLSYSYYDRRQLALSGFLALDAIFLGTINLDQTKASVFTNDYAIRYGITDRINLEANIPYVYRDSKFISGGAGGGSTEISEVKASASGIGDASMAAYYQLVKESARWPDLVTSLRVRAPTGRDPFGIKLIAADPTNDNLNVPAELPTGTGLWSVTLAMSALRTYDPVILFGNLGYTYYIPKSFDDISPVLDQVQPAKVKLGNPLQISGGLAIALNDRAAVSFSVSSSIAPTTYVKPLDARYGRVPGSSTNTTTLNIGASYLLPSGWSLNAQLASGLTPDSPNFVMAFRASHAF